MAHKSTVEIPPADELKLRWYFSLGISAFEFSTFGRQIELARLHNEGSFICHSCGGDGVSGSGAFAVICRACKGRGTHRSSLSSHAPSRFATIRCEKCDGVVGNDDCPDCGGDGYIESSGAFETGAQPSELHEPDISEIKLYGEVARVLRVLSKTHNQVLERFYGDCGERWARTDRGRMFSLYDLTKAGKMLLETFAKPTEACLPPIERIGVAAELERTKSVERRRQQLSDALAQSVKLYGSTASSWCAARQHQKETMYAKAV